MAKTLSDLKYTEGSKFEHFRKGMGVASGNGKTAGRGTKGQGAHAKTKKHGFEGGQMPLARRIPKFGFKNPTRIVYAIVNVEKLNQFADGETVDLTKLVEKGLVKKSLDGVKILGEGKLNRKLVVKADAFSKGAEQAIVEKGGTAEVIK
jgi:large subunit ribosomal protein L15